MKSADPSKQGKNLLSLISVLGALVIGGSVLTSWIVDKWEFLAFGDFYKPMSPVSSLLVLLIGTAYLLNRNRTKTLYTHGVRYIATIATFGSGLVFSLQFIPDYQIPIVSLHALHNLKLGDIPIARMSPLAAIGFLAISVILFCHWPSIVNKKSAKIIAVLASSVALLIGLAVFVG